MVQGVPQPISAQAAGLAVGLGLVLSGCSGTSFGDRLARSFSGAPQPPVQPAPASGPSTAAPAAGTAKPAQTATPDKSQANRSPADAGRTDANRTDGGRTGQRPAKVLQPMAPAPYRITIKLPTADPSAPAEVVTEALRQAGVPFEVEMIERVPASAGTTAATPAPRPR